MRSCCRRALAERTQPLGDCAGNRKDDGLVDAVVLFGGVGQDRAMAEGGFVYIMANRPRGTLYVGVTADLVQRVMAHRSGAGSRFVRRYNLHRLVYVERFDEIAGAIAREKQLKRWNRAWKLQLIEAQNPDWVDLFEAVNG